MFSIECVLRSFEDENKNKPKHGIEPQPSTTAHPHFEKEKEKTEKNELNLSHWPLHVRGLACTQSAKHTCIYIYIHT